jgi:hypothetical protein
MKTTEKKSKSCFVIMPISDMEGYDAGHFTRVYQDLIKPAAQSANYDVYRADDEKRCNFIMVDILRNLLDADMVICDLSGHNPNVLYELGIRHSFNKPVVLIRDDETPRLFDTDGFRYARYSQSLRADLVKNNLAEIRSALIETSQELPRDVNSIIQLLGIKPAQISNQFELSHESTLLYHYLQDIATQLTHVHDAVNPETSKHWHSLDRLVTPKGKIFPIGYNLYKDLEKLGEITIAFPNAVIYETSEDKTNIVEYLELDNGDYTVQANSE